MRYNSNNRDTLNVDEMRVKTGIILYIYARLFANYVSNAKWNGARKKRKEINNATKEQ